MAVHKIHKPSWCFPAFSAVVNHHEAWISPNESFRNQDCHTIDHDTFYTFLYHHRPSSWVSSTTGLNHPGRALIKTYLWNAPTAPRRPSSRRFLRNGKTPRWLRSYHNQKYQNVEHYQINVCLFFFINGYHDYSCLLMDLWWMFNGLWQWLWLWLWESLFMDTIQDEHLGFDRVWTIERSGYK